MAVVCQSPGAGGIACFAFFYELKIAEPSPLTASGRLHPSQTAEFLPLQQGMALENSNGPMGGEETRDAQAACAVKPAIEDIDLGSVKDIMDLAAMSSER